MNIRSLIAIYTFALVAILPSRAVDLIDIDLNKIGVNVSMNPEHYRELLERFEKGDTTLRIDQIATVYYGYSFTFDYEPTLTYPEIEETFKKHNYSEAAQLADEAIKDNPVSLELTIASLLSNTRRKDKSDGSRDRAMLMQRRLDMLVDIILSSGKGISPDTPFVVISQSDMDSLITDIIGANSIIGRTTIGDFDAVKIMFPGSTREHILYFDNTRQHKFESERP